MAKQNGLQAGRRTGYNGLKVDFNTFESNVRLVGYPCCYTKGKTQAGPIPLSKQRFLAVVGNVFTIFPGGGAPYWEMASTPGFTNDTSGRPWLINFKAATV